MISTSPGKTIKILSHESSTLSCNFLEYTRARACSKVEFPKLLNKAHAWLKLDFNLKPNLKIYKITWKFPWMLNIYNVPRIQNHVASTVARPNGVAGRGWVGCACVVDAACIAWSNNNKWYGGRDARTYCGRLRVNAAHVRRAGGPYVLSFHGSMLFHCVHADELATIA